MNYNIIAGESVLERFRDQNSPNLKQISFFMLYNQVEKVFVKFPTTYKKKKLYVIWDFYNALNIFFHF